jgi:hypothetical protein
MCRPVGAVSFITSPQKSKSQHLFHHLGLPRRACVASDGPHIRSKANIRKPSSVFLWKLHSTFRVVRDAGSGRAPTWPDAITRLAAGPASGIRTATLPYSLLATVRASPRLCLCTNGDRYRHMVGGPACLVAASISAASKQREAPGSISVPSENDGGAQSPSTGRTARLLTTSPL